MAEQEAVQFIDRLSTTYGNTLEMTDDEGNAQTYDLLAEFELNSNGYAIVQSVSGNDEPFALRIAPDPAGGWQLETIESDEEWEDVMEQYDEMSYSVELDGERE